MRVASRDQTPPPHDMAPPMTDVYPRLGDSSEKEAGSSPHARSSATTTTITWLVVQSAVMNVGATASVNFKVHFEVSWGQGVKLIGGHPKLGKKS